MITVIAILSLLVLSDVDDDQPTAAQYDHIRSSDRFIEQLSQDLPRAMRITGYRALLGLEEHVSRSGTYLSDIQSAYEEMLLNGSVNQTQYEIMDESTLTVFEQRMQEIADGLGITFSLSISNVTLEHTSPFYVRTRATLAVVLITKDKQTAWNFSEQVTSDFSIQELKDPLYAVETSGRVPVTITPVNASHPYITEDNDTTVLQEIYEQTQYQPDSSAPSFLMRFMGDLNASEHGIASLVDTKDLDSQDIVVKTDRSIVDYLYFGDSSTSTNTIINMPAEFVLDDEHLDDYDAQEKTT